MDRLSGQELVSVLISKFPDISALESRFDATIIVEAKSLLTTLSTLKAEYGFNYLADMMAVDNKDGFTVIYRVHSLPDNRQLVVKVNVERDNACLPTVKSLWGAADWQEREIYDLMGISFSGRSISRILLPEEFEGHPLRKDYQGGRQV
ncbi:MAG: NADH-quinone oxidoreductase subunit C [Methylocystaceae bacterium]